ncbi:MAG: M56 family metallopeptidase [Chloroflexota bacterium]|nr:M56 family metallopeptidase [Chloroflexota bacterium]
MTAPLALAGYVLLVGTVGAAWLRAAAWPHRSPMVGILAWQAASLSVLLALPLIGIAVALPSLSVTTSLADALHACALALREQYATPGGALVASTGLALAGGVGLRTAFCLAAGWIRTRSEREAQRRVLALVGRRESHAGAWLVDHPTPSVYCMPGRRPQVVVTTGAVTALDRAQMEAVLAHERAHLQGRHDMVLLVAAALQSAFPFVPLFRIAREQLAVLVEMHADDQALRSSDRRELATALVALAEGAAPVGTFGAGGASALARVRRLSRPPAPLGLPRTLMTLAAAASVVVVPVLMIAAPGMVALAVDYCPVGFPA